MSKELYVAIAIFWTFCVTACLAAPKLTERHAIWKFVVCWVGTILVIPLLIVLIFTMPLELKQP